MIATATPLATGSLQFATFHVGDLLLGVPLQDVYEINRQTQTTRVPQAPPFVRGVINLRGDVVTVIDPCSILGLPSKPLPPTARNVVIRSRQELVGLLVDSVSDIVSIDRESIDPAPANLAIDRRLVRGVYKRPESILLILDLGQALEVNECDNH